ncbi:MAG: hypothetical protein KKG98_00045, partial [Proteobacteria bacterium]|nr:hypothetical protein [Pseudomonadota bacterium]
GNTKIAFLLCALSSFACPKEETRKRHPSQSWPCGLPLLLAEGGTRQDKWGGGKFPLARSRAPERLPKRGFALFERSEFAKPRQHRGAQGIPPSAGQETQGAFSLVRFFGQAKK